MSKAVISHIDDYPKFYNLAVELYAEHIAKNPLIKGLQLLR